MYIDVLGSYRQTVSSGLTTGVAAGTATAGHILALRNSSSSKYIRLRALEVEAIVTTAFTTPQEFGFDVFVARSYSAAHTGATALTLATNDGKLLASYPTTVLTGRVADTGALTAGTHTLDANAIAKGSVYTSAVGTSLTARRYDFSGTETKGVILGASEGVVARNTIAMGAAGVVKWHFTFEWDECFISGL
jgi:hypothetical protein